jgi:ribonuclease HII
LQAAIVCSESDTLRIGVDENGLGARLGPLLVTAALASFAPGAQRVLSRLPKTVRKDLDDSKRLVSFGNCGLGEAWARALVPNATTPAQLVDAISREDQTQLQAPCPAKAHKQCWTRSEEEFKAPLDLVARVRRHISWFKSKGITIQQLRASPVCVGRLNAGLQAGKNRFVQDLHAMETLILELRERCPRDVVAICGKVGGIADYERYFGPLSGRLHVALEQSRPHSAYRFPGLGDVHFVQDADASDPLVMLASLVGKYLRELLMARISRFYTAKNAELKDASGYHDPVTSRLVELTRARRHQLQIPESCFERMSQR